MRTNTVNVKEFLGDTNKSWKCVVIMTKYSHYTFLNLDYPINLINSAINKFLRNVDNIDAAKNRRHDSSTITVPLPFKDQKSEQQKQMQILSANIDVQIKPAGLKHRSQVRSGHRSGHRSQVRPQVRSLGRIFFCQGNWLYFWGIQKFRFIKGVDNVNWPPYRDFGGRTTYLLLGLYHALVKWTSMVFNANTPLPKRLVLCWVWLKRITRNIN